MQEDEELLQGFVEPEPPAQEEKKETDGDTPKVPKAPPGADTDADKK